MLSIMAYNPEYRREYYLKNKKATAAASREYSQKYRRSNPEWQLLANSRERSKRKGLEHTLTVEDILIPETCPLLGIKLERADGKGSGGGYDASPSLDRIDSTKGYTPDNVWVISCLANRIKSNATHDQIQRVASGLRAKIEDQLYSVSSVPLEVVITPGTY